MVNPDRNLYEPPYDDPLLYESDLEPERPRSRPLVVLLGIVVLAAFAGVVWVAYNQGVKHGQTGAPPLLTADSGPTRVAGSPKATESVGPAPDKSYENWFDGSSGRPENVMPGAEQPRAVPSTESAQSPQDVAGVEGETGIGGPRTNKATELSAPAGDPRMDSNLGITGAPQPLSGAAPTPIAPGGEDITSQLPPVEAAPPAASAPRPMTAPKAEVPKPAPITPAPSAAVTTVPKPAVPAETVPPSEEVQITSIPPTAAPPPSAAPKGVTIQLGSFPDSALAAAAWSKAKSANQDLLGSYSPTIANAQVNGKTWYRLRVAGFADKAAAAAVCEQLSANGQACIIAGK